MIAGVRDFGVTLGGQVARIGIGLVTQSILAWHLGPADCGSLAVCLLFATILHIVFAVACDTAAVYFVSSRKFSLSEGVVYTLVYGAISSLVAISVGLVLIRLPLKFFSQASPAHFRLALVFVPFSLLNEVLPQLFTAIRQFKLFSLLTVGRSVSQLVFTVILVMIAGQGVRGALWASILTAALVVIFSLAVLAAKFGVRWVNPTGGKLLAMFRFALRYYAGKLSNKMNLEIGPLMLAFFATRTEIGWYALAARITQLVEVIPETMHAVLFPRVAGDREGRSRLVARSARVIGIVCGSILLALAVFAPPLVAVVFSPAFLPAVPFIRILAAGLVLRCMAKVLVPYLIGTDHPGHASLAVIAGAAANLGVIWFLLPRVGVIGAPWSMTASYLVSSAFLLLSFSRFSGLGLKEVFAFRRSDWAEVERLLRRPRGERPGGGR